MATYRKILKDREGNTIIPFTNENKVYSENEIDTGNVWIDGKHIYRRVWVGTITNSAGGRTNQTLWASSPIDKLINTGGWLRYGDNGINTFPHAEVESGNTFFWLYVQNSSKNLTLAVHAAGAYTNRPYQVWVEYTKSS